MHILYIDDDSEDREIFKQAINAIDNSFSCVVATDGKEGLELLKNHITEPDFIFVDVNMPVMGGKEFLYEVKHTQGFRSIPVIMYSTTSWGDEIKSYAKLGAYDFIIKPNSFSEVCEVLKATFRGEKKGLPKATL